MKSFLKLLRSEREREEFIVQSPIIYVKDIGTHLYQRERVGVLFNQDNEVVKGE